MAGKRGRACAGNGTENAKTLSVKPETDSADVMENIQEGGKRASNRLCGCGEELPREEMAGEGSEGKKRDDEEHGGEPGKEQSEGRSLPSALPGR